MKTIFLGVILGLLSVALLPAQTTGPTFRYLTVYELVGSSLISRLVKIDGGSLDVVVVNNVATLVSKVTAPPVPAFPQRKELVVTVAANNQAYGGQVLPDKPAANDLDVFLNGVSLTVGVDYKYDPATGTVSFLHLIVSDAPQLVKFKYRI